MGGEGRRDIFSLNQAGNLNQAGSCLAWPWEFKMQMRGPSSFSLSSPPTSCTYLPSYKAASHSNASRPYRPPLQTHTFPGAHSIPLRPLPSTQAPTVAPLDCHSGPIALNPAFSPPRPLPAQVAPNSSPFAPGWQLACSGRYNLDLGRQAHRWFAMQLVELGQQQIRAVDIMSAFYRPGSDWQSGRQRQLRGVASLPTSSPAPAAGADEAAAAAGDAAIPVQAQAPETGSGAWVQALPPEGGTSSCGAWVRLGDCRSRMLHVVYDGERLDEQVVSKLCLRGVVCGNEGPKLIHVPFRAARALARVLSLELRPTSDTCVCYPDQQIQAPSCIPSCLHPPAGLRRHLCAAV